MTHFVVPPRPWAKVVSSMPLSEDVAQHDLHTVKLPKGQICVEVYFVLGREASQGPNLRGGVYGFLG